MLNLFAVCAVTCDVRTTGVNYPIMCITSLMRFSLAFAGFCSLLGIYAEVSGGLASSRRVHLNSAYFSADR